MTLITGALLPHSALLAPERLPPPSPVVSGLRQITDSASSRGLTAIRRPPTSFGTYPPSDGPLAASVAPASEGGAQGVGGPRLDVTPSPTPTLLPTPTPQRTEVITYKVVVGDNPWSISQRFGISLDTVIWAN